MTKQKLFGAALGLLVVTVAVTSATQQPSRSYPNKSSQQPTTPTTTYTSAQVAEHGDAQSCWSSVNGTVYDLTPWINQHPGGEGNILSICGKDGSQAFDSQHGGQRTPEKILESYKIGLLK